MIQVGSPLLSERWHWSEMDHRLHKGLLSTGGKAAKLNVMVCKWKAVKSKGTGINPEIIQLAQYMVQRWPVWSWLLQL